MGVAVSVLFSAWEEILELGNLHLFQTNNFPVESQQNMSLIRTNSFQERSEDNNSLVSKLPRKLSRKNSINLNNCEPLRLILETSLSFKSLVQDFTKPESNEKPVKKSTPHAAEPPFIFTSPRPVNELDAAAVTVQKVYKSYRTRRNLADCAVVVEELWWKALDFATLKRSSVSFFNVEKPETAVSRWARAGTRAAKVGKGLSKDEKAQKLALQHWLEAIDPRHRYGHNLHLYYDVWFTSESSQPFFYWLDIGNGKEINLDKCPRVNLQRQCIKYLGPKERESYEVIIENGILVYKQSGIFVDSIEGSKWIFVLSTSRALYIGQKQKGLFQHSSFLAGGAITAAGRLVAHKGVLEAIWPYSGHYLPTEENFREFITFLEENSVDLSNVKKCAVDDDHFSFKSNEKESMVTSSSVETEKKDTCDNLTVDETNIDDNTANASEEASYFNMAKHLTRTWTTGAGPRISCVREYPAEMQNRALEQVNLSPRGANAPNNGYGPIPSPRPCPIVRLSPRLAYMGLPSPRNSLAVAN